MSKENKPERLMIATQIAQGLLASQDSVGWNLDCLCILSLKIADNLVHFNELEKLPEIVNTAKSGE